MKKHIHVRKAHREILAAMTRCSRRIPAVAVGSLLAVALTASSSSAGGSSKGGDLLTRSIYVPVVFSVDADLGEKLHVSLATSGAEIGTQPRTFMFTYFPELGGGLRPRYVELRLVASGVCSGEDMKTNVVVTPAGLQTADTEVDYDTAEFLRQLRAKRRDLRVSPVVIRVRCPEVETKDGVSARRPRSEGAPSSSSRRRESGEVENTELTTPPLQETAATPPREGHADALAAHTDETP